MGGIKRGNRFREKKESKERRENRTSFRDKKKRVNIFEIFFKNSKFILIIFNKTELNSYHRQYVTMLEHGQNMNNTCCAEGFSSASLALTSNPLLSSLYWTTSMKLPASVSRKYAESISVWICSLEHRLLEEWRGVQRKKKKKRKVTMA